MVDGTGLLCFWTRRFSLIGVVGEPSLASERNSKRVNKAPRRAVAGHKRTHNKEEAGRAVILRTPIDKTQKPQEVVKDGGIAWGLT